MANSKFSGAGFATGQTLTSDSSIAGLEETGPGVYENRRWTQEEFFQTSVSNGVGFLKFIFTGGQDCLFNHNGLTVNGLAYNQSNGGYQIVADTGNATSSAGISFKTSSALTEKMSINETISSKVNHGFEKAIIDGNTQTGTSGQVLSSTGTGVAWITPASSTSTLQQVLDSSNTADNNGNTGTIILTNSAQGRTATYGNENITTDYTYGIDVTGANNSARLSTTDGDVSIQAQGTGKFIILNGRVEVNGQSNTLDPGSGNTSSWNMQNCSYLLDGYSSTSGAGGDIRINSRGSLTMHTGNLSTTTPGGALSIFARGNTASLSTIDGTTIGGDVTISSSSGDVILKGGGDLILENTGLGTPTSGDYLIADGVSGVATWYTDPKAFVTLTGSPTWVIRNGYNATWNIGAGSETLTITATDGATGTLIVINNGGEITWPANSNWPDSTEPTLTTTGTDVFSFIYDGTNYYWSFGQNFGA